MKCNQIRGDMIQVYKIFHVKHKFLKSLFDVDSTSVTRMHKFEIKKAFVKNKVHKHFFSIQAVNDLDSLSPGVGNAVSLDRFKKNQTRYCLMKSKIFKL